jgi:Holliday junction DNA helicase RuvA
MYAYIKGTLVESSPHHAVLESAGIGFHIHTPLSLFSKLPPAGSSLLLHISLIVREDAHTLYGFFAKEEKQLFEQLIAISGVGPKTALCLIGHMPSHDLYSAVHNNQVQKLCKIPGIGKKTAERLIIELRDKKFTSSSLPSQSHSFSTEAPSLLDDATSALLNLGYNPAQVEKTLALILKQQEAPLDLSTLITKALRVI